MIQVRSGFEFPLLLAAQAEFAPQSRDAFAACLKALRNQFWLHTQRSIGLLGLNMHGLDGNREALVARRRCGGAALAHA